MELLRAIKNDSWLRGLKQVNSRKKNMKIVIDRLRKKEDG